MEIIKFARPAAMWRAIRIVGACGLGYVATGMAGLPDGYWAVITAIVVTQADFGATLKASRDRIIGTLIGAAAGLLVLEASLVGWPIEVTFWLTLVPLAVLTALAPDLRLCCVTLVVVVLVPSANLWQRPLDRVLEILIGCVASAALAAILPSGEASARHDG